MIQALNPHPLFGLLTESEIAIINAIGITRKFLPHESLIRIGERTRDILCIVEGSVSIRIEDARGGVVEIARLHEGSLIGEMNFILPTRRTANVIALTEVQAGIFAYQEFCRLLAQDAELASKIFTAINIQLTAKYLNMLRGL